MRWLKQARQAFSKAFKLEAIRLQKTTNKLIADLARERGIRATCYISVKNS